MHLVSSSVTILSALENVTLHDIYEKTVCPTWKLPSEKAESDKSTKISSQVSCIHNHTEYDDKGVK